MDGSSRSYDVIIIGSGAGGATVASVLARAGKSVLILERGAHLPREAENWDPSAVFVKRRYRTSEQWLDKDGAPFVPNTHYWVGGNTSFYGAALMRFRRGDFEQTRHLAGVSPGWPIRYEDMAPWYDLAEAQWEVRGLRGADPTDDPAASAYRHPPVSHDPAVAALATHLTSKNLRPFPLPLGVRVEETRPWASGCIRCQTCGGYPCLVKGKVDARTAALEPILDLPNVTLLTGRKVRRLTTKDRGRTVDQIVCDVAGREERYSADVVVLAAGAVNSAAILLSSANPDHPGGLANSSGQVGRNYMFHTLSAVVSMTLAKGHANFPKTLGLNDFYWRDPDGSFDWPMGHVQMLEYMNGKTLEGQVADMIPPSLLPDRLMQAVADRMLSFLALSEDLPDPDNRVTLTENGQIRLSYTHKDLGAHHRLVKRFEAALADFSEGTHSLFQHHVQFDELLPLYGTAHQCGTTRMGVDPRSSVVNAWCEAHDVDNLIIADTGVFVSSAAVNPTLTVVATGLRVADHLLARMTGDLKHT